MTPGSFSEILCSCFRTSQPSPQVRWARRALLRGWHSAEYCCWTRHPPPLSRASACALGLSWKQFPEKTYGACLLRKSANKTNWEGTRGKADWVSQSHEVRLRPEDMNGAAVWTHAPWAFPSGPTALWADPPVRSGRLPQASLRSQIFGGKEGPQWKTSLRLTPWKTFFIALNCPGT